MRDDFNTAFAKIDEALTGKADKSEVYTKDEVDTALDTCTGGAGNNYSKDEVDALLANKADVAGTYTKAQIDSALANKANLDSPDFTGTPTVNGVPIGSGGGAGIGQNLIINGALQIWQRGTSFTNPNDSYTSDRMRFNGTGTISAVGGTDPTGGMIVSSPMQFQYRMEKLDYSEIDGNMITLSYNRNGDVFTKTYPSNQYPEITGGRIVVEEVLEVGTYKWIKLEIGDKATPFAPRKIAEELAFCQRYYEKSWNLNDAPGSINSPGGMFIGIAIRDILVGGNIGYASLSRNIEYKVRKRVPATISTWNGYDGSTNTVNILGYMNSVFTSRTLFANSEYGTNVQFGNLSVAIGAGAAIGYHWTADAEL